jgi:hypothetical protein
LGVIRPRRNGHAERDLGTPSKGRCSPSPATQVHFVARIGITSPFFFGTHAIVPPLSAGLLMISIVKAAAAVPPMLQSGPPVQPGSAAMPRTLASSFHRVGFAASDHLGQLVYPRLQLRPEFVRRLRAGSGRAHEEQGCGTDD